MHQLQDDTPTLGMHRLGDLVPVVDLLAAVDARGATIAQAAGGRRGALGHDQAGTGTLAVVLDHGTAGYCIGKSATTRHGGHDNAVGQL
ncbi:hypothetical protein D3C77_653610 [compost metagenome]